MQDIAEIDDGLPVPFEVRDNCHQLAIKRLRWLSNHRAAKARPRDGPSCLKMNGCHELCWSDNPTNPSLHDFSTCSVGEKPVRATSIPSARRDECNVRNEFISISLLCASEKEKQKPIRLPLLGALLLAIVSVAVLAHDCATISHSFAQMVSDHSDLSQSSKTSIAGDQTLLPHRARSCWGSGPLSPMMTSMAMCSSTFFLLKLAVQNGTIQLRNDGKVPKLQRGNSSWAAVQAMSVMAHLGIFSWKALSVFFIAFLCYLSASIQRISPATPGSIIMQVRVRVYVHTRVCIIAACECCMRCLCGCTALHRKGQCIMPVCQHVPVRLCMFKY
jgi:hypothetical protein